VLNSSSFVFAALCLAVFATAGAQASSLKIGDAAPDWSAIIGVDDKPHSLSDYKAHKLVVVVFTCNHCPVAQAYQDRLIALQKDYENKGVQLIAINVNNIPEDKLEKMKERAQSKGFNFPYLYDPTQKIGHDYGATVTPHVFVLDKNRKIAYMGAVDDNIKADKVKKHYLKDAVDALLAGKAPPETVTKQVGCTIRYEEEDTK
jgi:peroxiredoxin